MKNVKTDFYAIVYSFFFDKGEVRVMLIESGPKFFLKGIGSSFHKNKETHMEEKLFLTQDSQQYLKGLQRFLSSVPGATGEPFYPKTVQRFILNRETEKEKFRKKHFAHFERMVIYACLIKPGWYPDAYHFVDRFQEHDVDRCVYLAECLCINLHEDSKSIQKNCGKWQRISDIDFSRRPDFKSDLEEIQFIDVQEAHKRLRRVHKGRDRNLEAFIKTLAAFMRMRLISPDEEKLGTELYQAVKAHL